MAKQTMNCPRCASTLEIEEAGAGELHWDCASCHITITQYAAGTA